MPTALIGNTGFVGGNLSSQHDFDFHFNSSNIQEITHTNLDLLVIAAPSAAKWKANQEPENDWKMISDLMSILETVTAKQVVLISTIDVYKIPINADEATTIDLDNLQPYGKHRFLFEQFIRKHFSQHLIVRLPGLFGQGLKKNFIFDMLNNNRLDLTHKDSVFQFYCLDNIWEDIQIALDNNLSLVNFATEPIGVHEIAKQCFQTDFSNVTENSPISYDMRSKYAAVFKGNSGYLYNKQDTIKQLNNFIKHYAV